jgi:predicted GNAT family acetyltransferase
MGVLEATAVVNVPEENRYELRLDGRLVGLADYRIRDGRILFTHTEVDRSLEGQGLGSRLVEGALEDAERQGLEAVAICPFVAWYIEQHQSPQ